MKRTMRQRSGCLFLCIWLLMLLPTAAHGETAWKLWLSEQQQTLAAGTAGEISFELQLDGFRDYGMNISVEWLRDDGEKTSDAPSGIRFANASGAPTDKTLRFAVDAQAQAGTYAFCVVVDGRRSEIGRLTIGAAERMPASSMGGQKVETHAIFGEDTAELTATLEEVDGGAHLQEVCEQVQVSAQDASIYQLHFYDAHGQELQSLEEKVYVCLPIENAQGADVYAVEEDAESRVGARASEDGLRIAVKNAGEYLVVCP